MNGDPIFFNESEPVDTVAKPVQQLHPENERQDLGKKLTRSRSNQLLFNSWRKQSQVMVNTVSIRDGTNAYQLLLECHINVAMCQIRQSLFLHAIVTLTTVLQYSRQNAQAYYLRGKCYFCLFDYRSAYFDVSQCIEIHKSKHSTSQVHQMNDG